jgi:hypothetical protein
MKRKLSTFWAVLLIAMLVISPVAAGGVSVKWGQGSIIADITGWGFARGLVKVTVFAQGYPVTTCTPPEGPPVPGNSSTLTSVEVSQVVLVDKNGKFVLPLLEGVPDFSDWTPTMLGCPDDSYAAHVDWVNWIYTTITINDDNPERPTYGQQLFYKAYNCTSTEKSVDCTAIKGH